MSHVVRSLAQSGLVVSVLLSWLAIGVAVPVQAAQSNGRRYEYPVAVVQTYVNACGSEGIEPIPQPVMYEICVCTIEEFQNEFSLKAFREIGESIRDDRDVPPAMYEIMMDCMQQVMLRPDV